MHVLRVRVNISQSLSFLRISFPLDVEVFSQASLIKKCFFVRSGSESTCDKLVQNLLAKWKNVGVMESAGRNRIKIFTWHIHGSYLYYLSKANFEIYIPINEKK